MDVYGPDVEETLRRMAGVRFSVEGKDGKTLEFALFDEYVPGGHVVLSREVEAAMTGADVPGYDGDQEELRRQVWQALGAFLDASEAQG